MTIKLLADFKQYQKGQVVNVTRGLGKALIDSGKAIAHKMMTESVNK